MVGQRYLRTVIGNFVGSAVGESLSLVADEGLTADQFENEQAFFDHAISVGGLLADLWIETNAFYTASVLPGSVGLSAAIFSQSSIVYEPIVSASTVLSLAGRLNAESAFYPPTVQPGAISVTPNLAINQQAFFSVAVFDASLSEANHGVSGVRAGRGKSVVSGGRGTRSISAGRGHVSITQ